MLENGWIKLHRSIVDNPIWNNDGYYKTWTYILMMANIKDRTIVYNNETLVIPRGSYATSIGKLADAVGKAKPTVYRTLGFLEAERMVERKVYARFTVISVVNYERYQEAERKAEQKSNGSVTQKKKDKKDKKKREITPTELDELADYFSVEVDTVKMVHEKILDYEKSKGKRYKDMKATIRNWIRRDLEEGRLRQLEVITPWAT